MKKILVVEDEKMLGEIYRDKFVSEGFDVHLALDAEEGLEIAKKIIPDLIVLDILLPRANGIDFLEKLRKMEETKEIKVIAFSNYDDAESKEKARELGAREYLIKTNHTPREILDKINKHLQSQ